MNHSTAPAPTYRLDQSYEANIAAGPRFDGPWPDIIDTPLKSFFGFPVRSRFGVAAGILGNSRWISAYSRLGFDILTFKTIRSETRLCGTPPNWMWLDPDSLAGGIDDPERPLVIGGQTPSTLSDWSLGGSFGIPSLEPAVWRDEIRAARASLRDAQVLIVSVVGTAHPHTTEDEIVADFAALAREAVECGAHLVEANLSCPNVGKREGQIFLDTELSIRIARAVRDAVGSVPVLLKVGELRDEESIARFLAGVAGLADGVVLMNSPARRMVRADQGPYFPPGREVAGVTGAAVKPIALRAIRQASALIRRHGYPLQIVGVGGVITPADARDFIDAGACAALAVTGAAMNPWLADSVKRQMPEL